MLIHALQRILIASLLAVLLLNIVPTAAQTPPALTPTEVVDSFYSWYLATDLDTSAQTIAESPYLHDEFKDSLSDTRAVVMQLVCSAERPAYFETQVLTEDEAAASMLVQFYFDGTPFPQHVMVTLSMFEDAWLIDGIVCGDDTTPLGVTRQYYDWYLAYAWQDPEQPCSPLKDRVYREAAQLSAELINDIDELLLDPPLGHYDPFVCGQAVPEEVSIHTLYEFEDIARVVIEGDVDGAMQTAVATLENNEGVWQISRVTCSMPPATTSEVFVNNYLQYSHFDAEFGLDRNSLLDWPLGWTSFLNGELLQRFMNDGLLVEHNDELVNALTCTTELPQAVTAAVVACNNDIMTIQMQGIYFDGDDSVRREVLPADVMVEIVNGRWQIIQVQCLTP